MATNRLPQLVRSLALAVVGIAGLTATQAVADPTQVTFNPAVVVPGASTFTADTLNLKDYSRVDLGTTTGSNTAFSEHGYLQVNNASLNTITFDPPGNRSTYSLYLDFTAAGTQTAPNFTGSSTGVLTSLSYTLYEVAGASSFGIDANNNPFVTNTTTPTAVANGSLINGTTAFSSNPIGASANVSATFMQSLTNFILSPTNATLTIGSAFNNNFLIVNVVNGGQSFTINGGGGDLSFTATPNPVPEPVSLALLGTGLAGLGLIRRKRT